MTDRKHPTGGFWLTVALAAMLAYCASIGPVHWIASRIPATNCQTGIRVLNGFYFPIWEIVQNRKARRAVRWYVCVGTSQDAFMRD